MTSGTSLGSFPWRMRWEELQLCRLAIRERWIPFFALNLAPPIITSRKIHIANHLSVTPPHIKHPENPSFRECCVLFNLEQLLSSHLQYHTLFFFTCSPAPLGNRVSFGAYPCLHCCICLLTGLPASALDPQTELIKTKVRPAPVLISTLQNFPCGAG